MSLRFIEKFVSLDGLIPYSFPKGLMQTQVDQVFRTPLSTGVGANYAHDHLGYGVSPKDPRRITVNCLMTGATPTALQTNVDEATSEIERIGKGWLYRLDVDGATYRRCLARPTGAPPQMFDGNFQFGVMPCSFSFIGLSDWQAVSLTTGSQTLTAYQTVVTVTNAGNIPVKTGIIFSLTAVTAAGWTNPEIRNMTTGEAVSTTRDSARVGDIWRIGDPDYKVGYGISSLIVGKTGRYMGASALGPQNYMNDYSLATVTKGFPTLNPGANEIRIQIDGTPNATFSYAFYGAFS